MYKGDLLGSQSGYRARYDGRMLLVARSVILLQRFHPMDCLGAHIHGTPYHSHRLSANPASHRLHLVRVQQCMLCFDREDCGWVLEQLGSFLVGLTSKGP